MLASIYAQQSDFESAEREYKLTIELESNSAGAYDGLAQLYGGKEVHLDEAVALSKKAVDLSPKSTSYLNTLALLYYKQRKYQEAEATIKKAIELAPENPLYREGLKQIRKAGEK